MVITCLEYTFSSSFFTTINSTASLTEHNRTTVVDRSKCVSLPVLVRGCIIVVVASSEHGNACGHVDANAITSASFRMTPLPPTGSYSL
jgi:hypothetical protein